MNPKNKQVSPADRKLITLTDEELALVAGGDDGGDGGGDGDGGDGGGDGDGGGGDDGDSSDSDSDSDSSEDAGGYQDASGYGLGVDMGNPRLFNVVPADLLELLEEETSGT